MFDTLDAIFRQEPLADAQVDAVHQLLLHGADPSPWIFVAFQHYARAKGREELLSQALTSRQPVQTQWIQSAIASPGPKDARVEALFTDATAIRDAGGCRAGASPAELAICLPNTLKSADAAVDGRFANGVSQLDHQCNLHAPSSLTRAGWLSYVLSDQSRATCVLGEMLQQRVGKAVVLTAPAQPMK